ncbi:MAG: acyl-CoA dehydratase activase-related protein [candidate division WOR-3 bacterium]
MKIGLPRALLYYRYGKFWQEFLAGLGHQVILSRETDKSIVQDGLGRVPSEVCLPIKILAGHVMDLASRVDVVFLPRIVWLGECLYACPKMIGIVDICRMMMFRAGSRLMAPTVKGNFFWSHFRAGLGLGSNPYDVFCALKKAKPLLAPATQQSELPPQRRRIGLIGHFYNTEDAYVARPVIETFKQSGYLVLTKEGLAPELLLSREGRAGTIRWFFERELYNAFRFFLHQTDGICVIVSMGCGPDSLIAEFMREEAAAAAVPFLELVIDEHTGSAGLVTRVEAFVELLHRVRPFADV